jgi:hypothetical protein
MKRIFQIALSILLVVNLTSCEKVIDINVKNSKPAISIVGAITDQPGPYTVSVNKSVNFSANNTFPPVADALVIMSDDAGVVDTLTHAGNGVYNTHTITGVSGRTYTLRVKAEGTEYIAVCTMPQPVPFDSLVINKSNAFGTTTLFPAVNYQDPPVQENFYRFVEYQNGVRVKSNFVRNDRLSDGNYNKVTLRNFDQEILVGDSLYVEMNSISKSVYTYLNELNDVDGETQTAAPSNPTTNFTNNPLGYFSAHTVQGLSVIVQ